MPNTITIRESSFNEPVFQLAVSFTDGPEYEVQLLNPHDPKQEDRFEWYFEQYLRDSPFFEAEKAKRTVQEIAQYGEALFKEIFIKNPVIFSKYQRFLDDGLSELEFAINGINTAFHAIHWEALKDPALPKAFAAEQANVFRKNRIPAAVESRVKPSPFINLLLVTARPKWEDDLNYRTITRPIIDLIESAKLRVKAHILRPGTYEQLVKHLNNTPAGFYHLIHFDTHGALLSYKDLKQESDLGHYLISKRYRLEDITFYEDKQAFLLFEGNEKGQAMPVSAEELAKLLTAKHIPVCMLNACQSAKQVSTNYQTSLGAKLMEAGVQAVLGQSYTFYLSAAKRLMHTLYKALFDKTDLSAAVAKGRQELASDKIRWVYRDDSFRLEDWLLPVFYQNRPVHFEFKEFTPEEKIAYHQQRKTEDAYHASSVPTYGFLGRDLDILTIEKRLLKQNMLLVRGMGGTGKTTLLKYLAHWWERTGFVKKSFYFGYDKQAYTLEQILNEIANQLFPEPGERARFQAYSLTVQEGELVDRLKTEPYCLILDNCESINGASLAIRNTLNEDEREKLLSFLNRLKKWSERDSQSIVVFGSRSDEQWMARHTFESNVYNLQGLDEEARTDLARKILERADLDFRKLSIDPEFKRLMKLLAGYPLAIEVILPNLRQKTAAEIIKKLKAGDINLDQQAGTDKTNSIIQCVDYSHSNLSPDAQKMLLCLSPFSGYFNQSVPKYIDELKQQPTFANYPFDQWMNVIDEAVKRGLMGRISGNSILQLQPIFPYFLQQKAQTDLSENGRKELEIAFRNYYVGFAGTIITMLNSKQAEERKAAIILTHWEYENVYKALQISLNSHQSINELFSCLSGYYDITHKQDLGLKLAQEVLVQIEAYPKDTLTGPVEFEMAGIIDNIGKRFLKKGDYKQARKSYEKALDILEKSQTFSAEEIKKKSASVYHQLGWVAQEERNWPEAKRNYLKAIENNSNDRRANASTYINLGLIAQQEGDLAEAKRTYRKAEKILTQDEDRPALATVYTNLGALYEMENKLNKAKTYLNNALMIFTEFNYTEEQAVTYCGLGNLAQKKGNWAEAKRNYNIAFAICLTFNLRPLQAKIYHSLGRLSSEEGDWQQAKSYYEKSRDIFSDLGDEYSQEKVQNSLNRLDEMNHSAPS